MPQFLHAIGLGCNGWSMPHANVSNSMSNFCRAVAHISITGDDQCKCYGRLKFWKFMCGCTIPDIVSFTTSAAPSHYTQANRKLKNSCNYKLYDSACMLENI